MVRYTKPKLLENIGFSHCAIEASAGTGKTYTLEHLIVQLILEAIPLEKILVVTFTKKATLELMARVREKLEELVALTKVQLLEGADIGGGVRECPTGTHISSDAMAEDKTPFWELTPERIDLLKAALMGFDRATISTIHGFCQQVLKDAAFEGGRLFQQEAVASEKAFDRAFTTLLRTHYATEHKGLLEVALRTQGGVSGVRKLIQEALGEAEGLDLPEFKDAKSFLENFPAALAQGMLDHPKSLQAAFPKGHKAIGNRLTELLERRAKALDSKIPEDFWLDSVWLKDKLLEELRNIRIEGLAGEAAQLSKALAELANFKAILVAAFLPPLREELLRYKTEGGFYDFDDMITLVAETLESPRGEGLVARLRERFQVALIDEFQDTDRRQWGIFSKVFLDSPEGHRLFLVGDPKQAIYGFRGGDLPTYVAALKAIKDRTGQEPLSLDQNFRSTKDVIQAYNAILQVSDETPFFSEANARHYQHPVTCGKPSLRLTDASGVTLPAIRAVDVPTGKLSARQIKLQAARALAAALKGTLETGRFNGAGGERALRFEDVFVLTLTLKEGKPIAQALKEVGIPSALYRQNGLFEGPEAEACRDILLAVESPFDECRRAKALLGPFFGLSFAETERARELPEGHPILNLLFGWRELAQQGRFGELFNRLVSESGLSQRLLFLDENQRALTNLHHILELLQQEALGGHCTLADLAIQVQRWIDGEDRPSVEEGETQRLERQGGAVQILTMHKAKGLQAPIVVLFGGTGTNRKSLIHRYHCPEEGPSMDAVSGPAPDTAWGSKGGGSERSSQAVPPLQRRSWVGPVKAAPAEVQALIEQEAQEEWERLVYVALTRAEAQLLLPRYIPGDEPPSSLGNFDIEGNPRGGLYKILNRRLQALMGSIDAPKTHPGIERIRRGVATLAAVPPPPEPWEARLPVSLARPDFETLRRQGCPAWVFSYSGLQLGLERIGAEDSALEEVKEPTLPGGPKGGKKFGTQVHALLQRVDRESFKDLDESTWMALPTTLDLAAAWLSLEDRADALRWTYQAMTRPMALPNGKTAVLCQSEEFLREMDFVTPYPERSDFLTGSIDLLFQSEGRTHVLDWKTNRLAAYDPVHLDETVQGHYLLQVKIYTVTACRFLGIQDSDHYERAFGGVVYVFLRGLPTDEGIWTFRPSWEEVQVWELDIRNLQPERLIPAHAGGERHV